MDEINRWIDVVFNYLHARFFFVIYFSERIQLFLASRLVESSIALLVSSFFLFRFRSISNNWPSIRIHRRSVIFEEPVLALRNCAGLSRLKSNDSPKSQESDRHFHLFDSFLVVLSIDWPLVNHYIFEYWPSRWFAFLFLLLFFSPTVRAVKFSPPPRETKYRTPYSLTLFHLSARGNQNCSFNTFFEKSKSRCTLLDEKRLLKFSFW